MNEEQSECYICSESILEGEKYIHHIEFVHASCASGKSMKTLNQLWLRALDGEDYEETYQELRF